MHIYTDTSHFRAPYKSLLSVAGFGADATSFQATPMQINAVAPLGQDGIRRYTPDTAATLMKNLEQWNAIQVTEDIVKVEPYTAEQIESAKSSKEIAAVMASSNAAAWVRQKVAQGFAVYAPLSIVWPTPEAMAAGVNMGVTPYNDKQAMIAASVLPIGAYLIEPGSEAEEDGDWIQNIALAAGVAVGLGIAVWAFTKMTKRSRALSGTLAK